MTAIKRLGGCPLTVCGDCGTEKCENVCIEEFQTYMLGGGPAA